MGIQMSEENGNGNEVLHWEWEWDGNGNDCMGIGGNGNNNSHSCTPLLQTGKHEPHAAYCLLVAKVKNKYTVRPFPSHAALFLRRQPADIGAARLSIWS